MRVLPIVLLGALLAATPATADDAPTMEQKLQDAFRGLLEDMKPALDDALDETLEFFGAFGAIDDPRHYAMPEVLPNGDIIIRRREDAPAYIPPPTEGNDSIDL